MDKGIETLKPVCVPKRIVRNWSTSVMRHCDYCSHYEDTVLNDDGSAICASCCDSEHSGNLQCALEEALQRNGVLIAALEQSHQEKSHLEYRLKNVQAAHLAGDERALRAERRVSELEKTLRGTEESLIAAVDQIAELEAASVKFVNLPDAFVIRSGHPINENERSVMIPKDGGNWFSRLDIEHALRVAGVKFDGGE